MQFPRGKHPAAVVAVFLLLAIAVLLLRPENNRGVAGTAVIAGGQSLASNTRNFSPGTPWRGPAFITGVENLPASLRGTDVDGAVKVDADGNLVIDIEVRYLFDYFLGTLGEEPLETIVARIHAFLRHNLPTTAAAQAEAALDGYLAYLDAMARLQAPVGTDSHAKVLDTTALRNHAAQLKELRGRLMDPAVAAAFFAEEDAYNDYTFARIDLLRDPSLSAVEKAARSTALIDTLPPRLQESMRTLGQYNTLQELTHDWQQRDGAAAELRSIREAAVGPAAADRLEALDAERAAWKKRVDEYLRDRTRILSTGLADADKARQTADLRNARFTAAEQLRLSAFETPATGSGAITPVPAVAL